MAKISVIVPAYNVEQYLEKCMGSILNQTFKDYEVLLVDDGSEDSTPELCDKIAARDQRVKVFHKDNGGLSDARNYALDRISGEYVAFIDGDDYVSLTYLEHLYMLVREANVQISAVQVRECLESDEPIQVNIGTKEKMPSEIAVRRMFLRKGITHSSCAKLYDATIWKELRFPEGQLYEDYSTTHKAFERAEYVVCSEAKMYFYVQRIGSIMHSGCSERTLSFLDIADEVTNYIIAKWPASKAYAIGGQLGVYMKMMQQILNTGMEAFPDYQDRIIKLARKRIPMLLKFRGITLKNRAKVISLLISKHFFLSLYNRFDRNLLRDRKDKPWHENR